MGKGFNNYMCKKFFHPASADNLKRVWIAQKKADTEKKAQDDLRRQYDREQELYQNKALLSKESKERLELNFMYEPPPGVKKISETDKDEEDGEPEYKFEWQRTWGHAPKESYLKDGDDFNEQPFGIQVCQAKCIKCGKYGHMNTDKRCPLYGKSLDHDEPMQNVDQAKLLSEMKAEGLAMRYSTWDIDTGGSGQQRHSLVEEERGVDRVEMLKNMSKEEKKKLLKKLKKMEKKEKKKSKKEKKRSSRSDSDEDVEWEEKDVNSTTNGHQESIKNGKHSPKRDKKRERSLEKRRNRSKERRDRSRSRDRRDRSRSKDRRDRSRSRDRRERSREARSRSRDRRDRKDRSDRSRSRDRHHRDRRDRS